MTILLLIAKTYSQKRAACRSHNKVGKLLLVLFQKIVYISVKCHRLDIKICFSFWMGALQSKYIIPNIYLFLKIAKKNYGKKRAACRLHKKIGKLLRVLFWKIIYISLKCNILEIKISSSFQMGALQSQNIIPNI